MTFFSNTARRGGRYVLTLVMLALGGALLAQDRPDPGAVDAIDGGLFEMIPPKVSGIDFAVPIDTEHPDDRLYYSAMACGGVAAGDLDGDGRVDLFFACGAVPNRLYRQTEENFVFEDVTSRAGVAMQRVWSTGAALADVDNDGDLDVYVTCYDDPNRLFVNSSTPGKMVFHERAADVGLDVIDASLGASFVDYDRDGDLDVFLPMNAYYRDGGRPENGIPMQQVGDGWRVVPPWDRFYGFSSFDAESGEPKYAEVGRPNRLMRNENGRFVDVSALAGILGLPSMTNSVTWWDHDGDGWLDLHVGNDFADRDEFYRNLGNGRFSEMAATAFQHTTWFSMGSAAEDLNNDGRVDFVAADMLPTSHYREKVTMGDMEGAFDQMWENGLPVQRMANTLFLNTGTGLFLETAFMSGLARTDWSWTVKGADFDGDSRMDLFFPTGHSRDFTHSDLAIRVAGELIGENTWDRFEDKPELREKNLAFRNVPTGGGLETQFEKRDVQWGLSTGETMSYGGALADIDQDGDLDLVVMNLGDPPTLYRNSASGRDGVNFLNVRLKGTRSNRYGIGAVVRVDLTDGRTMMRTLTPHNGYLESDAPELNFGLGEADSVMAVSVQWPSGTLQVLENVAANRRLEIEEAEKTKEEPGPVSESAPDPAEGTVEPLVQATGKERLPWFVATGSLIGVAVRETPFDDFARQPLLPNKLSQLGPGQAWGDVDGDGFPDIYLGSPSGALGRLLLSRGVDEGGRPKFAMRLQAPFDSEAFVAREDMGVLFFDADGDDDLDLFVVSGGVEWGIGDGRYQDRLYLNEGTAAFVEAPLGALPESTASGGPAAAADFDRDGDIDVFVGGRVTPGRYPTATRSQLLVNDGTGKFSDGTNRLSVNLARTGMVTAALWSDVDNDGWLDLMLAHEWGLIDVFRNQEGQALEKVTAESGLENLSGFWNSLAGRDFDGDGDIDYLAGNLGRNSKYTALPEKPEVMLYGDLDGSGKKHIIEAKLDKDGGELLPRRGFSCSSRAMPSLTKSVGSFHDFASSTLAELYTPQRLEKADRYEVNSLASVALINDGNGHFQVIELPWLAQVAPVFGIAITELDGDGIADAVLAQNFYSPQKETGAMDGGLSLVLKGGGIAEDGFWQAMEPSESGVVISGDAKSIGVGDLDNDARPDLLFGVNDAAPRLLMNETDRNGGGDRILKVSLRGPAGNRTAIGARLTLKVNGLPLQVAEQQAGSGYLSQNSDEMFFGLGGEAPGKLKGTLSVRWPSGELTEHPVAEAAVRSGVMTVIFPQDDVPVPVKAK
jgi:hypothetical protein